MTDKLKTIKDLTVPKNMHGRAVEIFIEDQKKEAIKWVKAHKYPKKEEYKRLSCKVCAWIRMFFDLKDEDLK